MNETIDPRTEEKMKAASKALGLSFSQLGLGYAEGLSVLLSAVTAATMRAGLSLDTLVANVRECWADCERQRNVKPT